MKPALFDRVHSPSHIPLENGSRVGIVGGGPAGSFFAYFLLQFAGRMGLSISVDIYEPKDFSAMGPAGCNMCAGVVSESLIQALSIEGIELPGDVVQRGINAFVLHTDSDLLTMAAPFNEMRIAAVYRGGGPPKARGISPTSFDRVLLQLAGSRGANVIRERVTDLNWSEGKPRIRTGGRTQTYDLVAGAFGVNSTAGKFFEDLDFGYRQPRKRKTYNCEVERGSDIGRGSAGGSMHAFLLNLPEMDFAAVVPKRSYFTLCLLGRDINPNFVHSFLQHPAVKPVFSAEGPMFSEGCRCAPWASLGEAKHPYGDRVVLIGDCGMSRLNKDGIGSAYRTAKAAAATAVFSGISGNDFRKGFGPICRSIRRDNRFGSLLFFIMGFVRKIGLLNRSVMRMARAEQQKTGARREMTRVLWDMLTGSAPYRDIFLRTLHPAFVGRFFWNLLGGMEVRSGNVRDSQYSSESREEKRALGRSYCEGDVIVRKGEKGDCMYVIQSGRAEVLIPGENGKEIQLGVLSKGDFFGERAIIEDELRSATVKALTEVRVIVVD
ncbi:MAG TPA: cyclic nucleotide-binding domain-containing protein, partial [Thermodesulfobacteriota bacterium]|nr:cyclic nucleotide-binding domain-containing protein [Thermodesulfobacteriota bacterium]